MDDDLLYLIILCYLTADCASLDELWSCAKDCNYFSDCHLFSLLYTLYLHQLYKGS